MLRHRMLVWVVILALLGGAGWYGIDWFRNPAAAPIEYPASPTHQSPDGAGKLTVPDRVTEGSPKVTFRQDSKETAKAARSIKSNPKLAFRPAGSTMDIVVSGGSFHSDKVAVTLKYDPKQIPKGLTAQQVGMAVYDQRLNSWIPLLGAKADPETNTVTALAPHFSWFSAIVLDPAKKVVEIAGEQIKTTIDNTVTIGSWTINLVSTLANNLIDDLFVRVDDATCSPISKRMSVQTTSDFDRLKACTEQAGDNDRLRLTNKFAFPMRSAKRLPPGITLSSSDIMNNGENLPELLQSWFWASKKRLYLSGASRAEATITPEMGQQEKVGLELDSESIAANIGLSVLMVFSPDKGAAKGALKKVVEKSVTKNKVVRDEAGEPEAWVNQTYDLLNCIVSTEHDSIDQPLKREGFEAAADLAHGCLGGVLDAIDLQGALAEVLSSLKSIPAVIEGMVYSTGGALLDTLPKAFDQIKQKQPSVTVVREGNATSAKPKPKSKPSKKPQAQPSNKGSLGALAGEWKAGGGLGLTTLYLKSKTSTYKHFGPCSTDPDSTNFVWCTVTGTLTLTAYDAKYVDVRWGEPIAKDRSGTTITLVPEVSDRFSGTSVISLAPDGRAIAVDNGLYSGIEFCNKEMYKMSRDTSSVHQGRCSGTPK